MKKIISLLLSVLLLLPALSFPAFAQTQDMRAVWIATVFNMDYPATKSNVEAQKKEFTDKLDSLKAMGFNAVVVQVRPKADALYQSAINPWSEVLTGTQGQNPGYDPMAFMIEEAHKRSMQFHAWLNPYRVTTTGTDASALSQNHPARLHPNWLITYKNALYYNPASPEVMQHISETVAEIVTNYAVDGVHFDDYFYPAHYPLPQGETDSGATAIARRQNVTQMIEKVHSTVKSIKPTVLFGVSPSGIWRNAKSDPAGSATTGSESYNTVYADSRAWIQQGIIDYIVPQIYWETGHKAADYETLVAWWNTQVSGTKVKLYIGQGLYKDVVSQEIEKQMEINKKYTGVNGSFFFSCRDLLTNRMGCADTLTAYYKKQVPAIAPGMPAIIPGMPPIKPELPQIQPPSTEPPSTPEDTDTAKPDTIKPDTIKPDTTKPDTAKPDTAKPDTAKPDIIKSVTSTPTTATIFVNGTPMLFDSYNIEGYNYFKLRDIATSLHGTKSSFEVSWDAQKKAVRLTTGTSYTPIGGEMTLASQSTKTATTSTDLLFLNGNETVLDAYKIDGSNYYKLRDLAKKINFSIEWDEKNASIYINS